MDKESVTDFLGCVPLIQRLPISSLKKIADLVRFQHYAATGLAATPDVAEAWPELKAEVSYSTMTELKMKAEDQGYTAAFRSELEVRWSSDLYWEEFGCCNSSINRSRLLDVGLVTPANLNQETGDHIIQEGRAGNGIYFIWDGEAEVFGSGNPGEGSRSEYQLKRYDYFGHGGVEAEFVEQANVIASSKLTCLVLPTEHCHLLQPKSIWNADETCSLMESILHLESVEVDLFKGITLADAIKFDKVFGGQMVGQALAAASKSVDCFKLVHSLHAYFLLSGDFDMPILYRVHRLRDGKSFATRKVDAIQRGIIIFSLLASFQKEETCFEHQCVMMPSVPDPESLLSMEELRERRLTDPRLSRSYRNKVAKANFVPWPVEIRFCDSTNNTNQTKGPARLRYWFRARGGLSEDQALHKCVVAYVSDLLFISASLNPHRSPGIKLTTSSLDHAMWFHKSVKADDWILFVISSPVGQSARGFVTGQMFNRKGELIVSLTQEGLLRKPRLPSRTSPSKL